MSLSDVIARFSTAAADGTPAGYPVTRRVHGSFNSSGIWVGGSTSSLTLDMCVMPYGGGLKVLPEGIHEEDIRVIVCASEIKMSPTPDIITIAGDAFSVFDIDGPFNFDGAVVWRAYAARQATT